MQKFCNINSIHPVLKKQFLKKKKKKHLRTFRRMILHQSGMLTHTHLCIIWNNPLSCFLIFYLHRGVCKQEKKWTCVQLQPSNHITLTICCKLCSCFLFLFKVARSFFSAGIGCSWSCIWINGLVEFEKFMGICDLNSSVYRAGQRLWCFTSCLRYTFGD